MKQSILEKFGVERGLIFVIIIAIVLVFAVVFYLFFAYSSKNVELISPLGREEWEIGQTYEIKWKSKGVERIGIALFNADKPEWVAENLPASQESYQWKIQPGHEYGPNFWVAVFEYPWRQGNQISYSKGSFSIIYPELASCDSLSIQEEWPHLASDIPDVRRVFITEEEFTGDLGGLDGANEKCRIAAAEKGFSGNWTAFIGGEDPENTAVKRIGATPRGITGVFIDAEPASQLIRGATCHRILGKTFMDFLNKLSGLEIVNRDKLSDKFLASLNSIWLGRIDESIRKSCVSIGSVGSIGYISGSLAEKYSYTVTCQDWTYAERRVENYDRSIPLDNTFPYCYTPSGEFTYAVAAAGISSDLIGKEEIDKEYIINSGKFCTEKQHLLCIED